MMQSLQALLVKHILIRKNKGGGSRKRRLNVAKPGGKTSQHFLPTTSPILRNTPFSSKIFL